MRKGCRAGRTWTNTGAIPRAAIGLIAASNQTPRAPSGAQIRANVAPKIALTPMRRIFEANSDWW
jgi:hypothetical protein